MRYIPGQLLLRIREDAVLPHLGGSPLRLKTRDATRLPAALAEPLEYLRTHAGLKAVRPIFSQTLDQLGRTRLSVKARGALAMLSSVAHSRAEELAGINLIHFDPKHAVEPLIKTLTATYAFEICEPVPARWHMGALLDRDPVTNWRGSGEQWGLRAIRWFDARIPDASRVTVAILDTGIDTSHPDFQRAAIGYTHTRLSTEDVLGHGTHVSGIIDGIAKCRLAVWKIFGDEPEADGEFYVDGERYLQALRSAPASGARVMNLSIGGPASSRTEDLLFRHAIASGCTVVAAMGNEYQEGNSTEYPGAYQDVLAVGAIAENLRRAPFSNTGFHIGLTAPGVNIVSTLPIKPNKHRSETNYASWSGTSMATPHVSAAAALVAAKYPDLSAIGVRERVLKTTTRLAAMGSNKKTAGYGFGLLNLQRALE